jgi:hypothetical protein
MVRVGLLVYLIVATAAGPWLCCCTAAHFAALHTPATPQPAAARGEEPVPSCCSHKHAASAAKGIAIEPAPPAERSCACKDARPSAAVPAAEPTASAGRPRPLDLPAFADGALPVLHAEVCVPDLSAQRSAACAAFPVRGCRDILHALHVLRC